MKRHFHKKNLFMLLFFMLSIFTLPSTVWASTARVDTKPENLVQNGEFAVANFDGLLTARLKKNEICDANGNLVFIDHNNDENGGYDSTAPLPGWSYYIGNELTRTEYDSSIVLWAFPKFGDGIQWDNRYSSSEENAYLFSNAYYKGDYIYQNVVVEGNRKYNFSCLRCSIGGDYEKHDLTEVVLVELDSNKQVLRTAKNFPDDDTEAMKHEELRTLTAQFVTSENTAYVQIRFVGDPLLTRKTTDTAFDSIYLAAVAQNTQVNYYAGNAENTANGSLIKTVTSDKKTYVLSADIAAITPANCTFSGWKCVENGKTYSAGTTMTLPATDTATMVAQWKKAAAENITISFNRNYTSNDTTIAASSITVKDGEAAGDKWPAAPTRAGYMFMGWNTERDLEKAFYYYIENNKIAYDSKIYSDNTVISVSAANSGIANNKLPLYATWMRDADGNDVPDAMQVKIDFKASGGGKLTNPASGSYKVSEGEYSVYIWRGDTVDDAMWEKMKDHLYNIGDTTGSVWYLISQCMNAPATLQQNMIPGTSADAGETFNSWSPDLPSLPKTYAYTERFPDERYYGETYTAQFSSQAPEDVTVRFIRNHTSTDNTEVASAVTVKDGEAAGTTKWPAAPTRSGYIFIGWSGLRYDMDTEEPVDTRMYTADTLVDAGGDCVTNNVLTLYALWLKDEDGNGYPDALQVRVTFKAGTNGKLTDPSNGAKPSSDGTYTVYLWRAKIGNDYYNNTLMKYLLSKQTANWAAQQIHYLMGIIPEDLKEDMIPGTVANSGYRFSKWSPDISKMPRENTDYTAEFASDTYTLTLDTHGVYPLLYSGRSSQDLAFTLKDGSGKVVTDNTILNQVTFTMELTDGFEKFKNTAGYAVVTLNGSKITAKKSGVVKIYAKYKDVVSSDFAVVVVPGDLNRSGSIDLDDAVQEAVILRDTAKVSEFGTYGKELSNMNNLNDGVDVDDIVKIVAMVRGISDYYN